MEDASIRGYHSQSENEWGILDPPALQQVIVNVGMEWGCDR